MSLPLSLFHSLKIRNTKVEKRLVKPSTLYLLHQQGVYIVISIHMAKLKISIRYQQYREEKEHNIRFKKKVHNTMRIW